MNWLLSSIVMAGLFSPVQGQPAKADDPAPAKEAYTIGSYYVTQVDAKQPTSLEQAITQALTNHPDMRLAEAELRVAEAKLAQARIIVSQKVTEDFHRLEKDRAEIKLTTATWERIEQLQKKNMVSKQEVEEAQHQLARAKARLAATESSWKLVMGNPVTLGNGVEKLYRTDFIPSTLQGNKDLMVGFTRFEVTPTVEFYRTLQVKTDVGTADILDQLKTKLGTKVKLDKQTNIDMEQAFQKVTEGAGLKVRVKLPVTENKTVYKNITRINLDASEYPLHAWLQLIVDEMNSSQVDPGSRGQEGVKGYALYVREYGLLLTTRDLAPPDAITVQELWKQSQFEKATSEAKKAQESATPKK